MIKFYKLPSIPNVQFSERTPFRECRKYNPKLTIEEYNEVFGIKPEKKEKIEKKEKPEKKEKK